MDPLQLIVCWLSVTCFVGFILFGIIGNHLLDCGTLTPAAAERVRRWLGYISNEPMVSHRREKGLSPAQLHVSALLAVAAAAKVAGKSLSPEDQREISEMILKENEARLSAALLHP